MFFLLGNQENKHCVSYFLVQWDGLNKHISLKIHSDLSDGINTALNYFIAESVLEPRGTDLEEQSWE